MDAVISERLFKKKQKSSFDMLNRNWVFILLFSDIILSLLITTIIVLLSLLWFLLLQLLFWLILLLQLILRNKVGESSKKGIQAAWSTPIHHVKWWISHFRGIYRALPACEAGLFLILLKCIQPLRNVTRSSVLAAVGVLYLSQHFIIIVIIAVAIIVLLVYITFVVNIIFIISIIRIFIKSSLLFFWGKFTVWFCSFNFFIYFNLIHTTTIWFWCTTSILSFGII